MMNDSSKSTDRLLSTLGLCVKAGKVIFGVPMVCEAMRKGGKNAPVLVLEAADTSDNTHKKISDKCNYYNTKHIRLHISLARWLLPTRVSAISSRRVSE